MSLFFWKCVRLPAHKATLLFLWQVSPSTHTQIPYVRCKINLTYTDFKFCMLAPIFVIHKGRSCLSISLRLRFWGGCWIFGKCLQLSSILSFVCSISPLCFFNIWDQFSTYTNYQCLTRKLCNSVWLSSQIYIVHGVISKRQHSYIVMTVTHLNPNTSLFIPYTGCPRRKGPNFGRVFLRSNCTDITQNTYIQSSMVTEILAREVWNFDSYYSLIDFQIHIETDRNMWFL